MKNILVLEKFNIAFMALVEVLSCFIHLISRQRNRALVVVGNMLTSIYALCP